ncbi:MAG: winged helix-turn-helix domain-containing protein [Candidatus Methanoperedens sp.]|nr:winged helix-turn-helix domain-containing protein [Candidatus Methanoperedens sp.]
MMVQGKELFTDAKDNKLIKSLSSDIRRDILKKLNTRNKTVSELSRELKAGKSTIFYNISILQESSLVKKLENGNEFVYYELTDNAKELFDSKEKIKFTILLTSTIIAFLGGIVSIYRYFENIAHVPNGLIPPMPNKAPIIFSPQLNYLIVGAFLLIISTFLFIYIFKILKYGRAN